jgi:flavin-dependent dehydrogenase
MPRDYDAIIVGASFAGLAVTRRLRGRILLLDRHEVGAVQTSACGTPLWVPQAVGVEESVLQVHDKVVVHAPTGTVVFDVSEAPYCTFDYRKFCCGLRAQSDAHFVRTAVRGLRDGAVDTDAGRFVAPCIVDCSGWRGVLLSRPEADMDGPVSFGLETEAAYRGEALYFWATPGRERDVISWIFPVGGASRVGVGSYSGESKLKAPLTDFMKGLGLTPTKFHGTYFPSGLREPTVGAVFAVGDAAGQCLPLTAEGIRPALYFGDGCGRLVQAVIDGQLTLPAALAEYRRRVLRYRHAYRALRWAQRAVLRVPRHWLGPMAELANRPAIRECWWPRYAGFGRPDARGSLAARSVKWARSDDRPER